MNGKKLFSIIKSFGNKKLRLPFLVTKKTKNIWLVNYQLLGTPDFNSIYRKGLAFPEADH